MSNGNTKKAIAVALILRTLSLFGLTGCSTKQNSGATVDVDGSVKTMYVDTTLPTPSPASEQRMVIETIAPTLEPVAESTNYEGLTTERFEDLVANFMNKYNDVYEQKVNTNDVTKFATITNIDVLCEDNPELIGTVANGATREEFLNDGAKIIGATVMYDFSKWDSTNSTKEFVKVSELVYGEQKEKMLKIEEYVDRIADAANQDDAVLVNSIVREFLIDMNSGSLSKLDDGVGFAAQVNIALIADVIARNYLDQQNFDMLQVLKTSEKYISNIFTEYERCTGDVKTYTRK